MEFNDRLTVGLQRSIKKVGLNVFKTSLLGGSRNIARCELRELLSWSVVV